MSGMQVGEHKAAISDVSNVGRVSFRISSQTFTIRDIVIGGIRTSSCNGRSILP
jgi:hypothetical protein